MTEKIRLRDAIEIRSEPYMKNDRLRIPVEPAYLSALGIAAYTFAVLEWNAVWCCERIVPNSINSLVDKTAGGIAKKLNELASSIAASAGKSELCDAAAEFARLVQTRNGLLHAKPGTDTDGSQHLFRDGRPWNLNMIEDAADAFAACSIQLNALLHGFLKTPTP